MLKLPSTCSLNSLESAIGLATRTELRKPVIHKYADKYRHIRSGHLYLALLLIAHSGDVEVNPGPRTPKYPCQICSRAVKWNQRGVACDECQQWYHCDCMCMPDHIYETLDNVSWCCLRCGMPNFSTSLFDSFSIDSSNSFSTLDSTNITSELSFDSHSPGPPIHSSSPMASKPKKTGSKLNNVKILTINFQSIKNKKEELGNLLESSDPDVIIGTETWLNHSIHSSEFFPPSYEVLRRDRSDGYGGVLLAIKRTFIIDQIDLQNDEIETIFAKISINRNQSLIVGSIYRPPSSNLQYMKDLCSVLSELQCEYINAIFWLSGDLNLPDIGWKSLSVEGRNYQQEISSTFIQCISELGLEQIVNQPTRNDNILDIFLTNRPSLINRCTTIPGLGDHDIVYTDSHIRPRRNKPVKRKIYLWKRANITGMKEKASSFQKDFISHVSSTRSVQGMWEDIKTALIQLLEEHVPSKMSSTRFNQPWVNSAVKRASRKKKKSFKKAKQSRNQSDVSRYLQLKKNSRKVCKKAYKDYVNNLVDPDSNDNPKKFWTFINSKKCDSTGVAALKSPNGITYSDSQTKANILNDQFISVFNKNETTNNIPDKGTSTHPDMPHINVTNTGVEKLLRELKPHKATGPDQLPTRLLKELSQELAPVFTHFFQSSLDNGTIPEEWKTANVVPIYKKGERNKPSNYRPVSLTSVTCKILEHIVTSSIMKHLDKHAILTDAQHGFRKQRSCESQLILTLQDLAKNIDTKEQTDVILLDFSKAFDKVPHERLLYKINYYGIRKNTLLWISDFLHSRTQQVVLDGSTSRTAPVQSGVPQGSVLGPLLFLLYINDLPESIQHQSTARLFADDCILYRKIRDQSDANALQADLDNLQRWEEKWMMEFHPEKCQVINVTNKKKIINSKYTIHGHTLETVDSAKYLGVTIHKSLSWNTHISNTVKKANNTRAFVQRNTYQCPRKTKELCYKTLIRPITEYASVIWDPHTKENINRLEMVQRRSARYVMGDFHRTSSVSAMLQTLNWPPLQERRAQARTVMMYRIVYSLVDIPISCLPPTMSAPGRTQKYIVPFARTLIYQHSFFPDGIRLWNALPQSVTGLTSLNSFRSEVQTLQLR